MGVESPIGAQTNFHPDAGSIIPATPAIADTEMPAFTAR